MESHEQNRSSKCPVCLKINYCTLKEEFERWQAEAAKKKEQLGAAQDENEDEEGGANLAASRYSIFNEDQEEDKARFHQHMMNKKLEQFDIILDDINLELSEFEEEMAT